MADAREMDADLMRPSGADADFKKRKTIEAAEDVVFTPGGTSVGESRGHTHALPGIAGYGFFDAAAIQLYVAVNQR